MSTDSLREALARVCDHQERLASELSIRSGAPAVLDIPVGTVRSLLAAHPPGRRLGSDVPEPAEVPHAFADLAAGTHPQTDDGADPTAADPGTTGAPAAPSSLTLDRDAVVKAMRERLLESNFNANLHEPIRTQTIDQWVDLLAGGVVALARPSNEVKAEALEQAADYGIGSNDPECADWLKAEADRIRAGGATP